MTVTYGSGKAGGLGRIYDRLRKRAYRATLGGSKGHFRDAIIRRPAWDDELQYPVVDMQEAYTAGVRDALNAVARETNNG